MQNKTEVDVICLTTTNSSLQSRTAIKTLIILVKYVQPIH